LLRIKEGKLMMLNSFLAKGSKFIAYHWRIAVLILLLLCIVGIPGTWLLVKRTYVVTGAVRIAPIWSPGSVQMYLPHYQRFMHAQSEMVISDQVIERVADDLTDKGLAFFEGRGGGFNAKLRWRLNYKDIRPKPTTVLKQAILDKVITAEPAIKEALIKISMRWPNSEEAIKIVDSFIRNYIIVSSPTQGGERLAVLKKEQKKLAEKLKSQREQLNALAREFGAKFPTTLDKRQEIKSERMGMLLNKITEWEARRIDLEAQVEVLKNRLELPDANTQEQITEKQKLATEVRQAVDQSGSIRLDYINTDPILQALMQNLAVLEQELIIAIQRGERTPETQRKAKLIEFLKERIEQRKTEVGEIYDEFIAKKTAETEEEKLLKAKKELANVQTELELTKTLEQRFKNMLAQEDTETIDLDRRRQDLKELQEELTFTKEIYHRICRRIDELDIERKRPPLRSVAYNAHVVHVRDVRWKITIVLVLGVVVSTILLFISNRIF